MKRGRIDWTLLIMFTIVIIIAVMMLSFGKTTGFAASLPQNCGTHTECGENGICVFNKCIIGTGTCANYAQSACDGGFCVGNEDPYLGAGRGTKYICIPGHIRDYVRDGGLCGSVGYAWGTSFGRYNSQCRPQHVCVQIPRAQIPNSGVILPALSSGALGVCMPGQFARVSITQPIDLTGQSVEQVVTYEPPPCGNGQLDPDEECDFGMGNADALCTQQFGLSACRADCICTRQ